MSAPGTHWASSGTKRSTASNKLTMKMIEHIPIPNDLAIDSSPLPSALKRRWEIVAREEETLKAAIDASSISIACHPLRQVTGLDELRAFRVSRWHWTGEVRALVCAVLVALGLGATSSINLGQPATGPSDGMLNAFGCHAQDGQLAAGSGTSADTTDPFEEIVKELSKASDPSQRVHAAELLGQLGDRRATKPLIAALDDPDHGVRRAVALALGQLRDHQAVPPLLKVLQTSSDPSVRGAVAFALGLIEDRTAVEPLIRTLKDPDASVRISSAIALGRLGDPRAVEPLLALPHDKAHRTCLPIAIALGQIKSERAIRPLLDGLSDENPDVCQNTAIALVLIGNKSEVEPLIKALQSQNPIVRRSAAYALGLLNDKRATTPLVARLQDANAEVRLSAVKALGNLKDLRSAAALRRVVRSDKEASVRAAAKKALNDILAAQNPAQKKESQ